MSQALPEGFGLSAAWLLHMMDIPSDRVLLSKLTEADYRAASFLDQRIFSPDLEQRTLPWAALETANIPAHLEPSYIFHIGHVGSTLVSRLLGELPGFLAVREPQILRDFVGVSLAQNTANSLWSTDLYDARLGIVKACLSRTFHDSQRAIIKASSFVSEIAGNLINEGNKSLFLYVPLRPYMETIFAGDGSQKEAEHLAPLRLKRFSGRLGTLAVNPAEMSLAQKIALGWVSEMTTLWQTFERAEKDTILWQDFGAFLQNPGPELSNIANHFDLDLGDSQAQTLIAGPIMNSYSKAPEHDYSPNLRAQLLRQARENFGLDIDRAMDWVRDMAKDFPVIETIIHFTEQSR